MNRTKQELEERLLDYLYEEMSETDRSDFADAISEHPDLMQRLRQWQSVQKTARRLPGAEFPVELHAKLVREAQRTVAQPTVQKRHLTLVEWLGTVLLRPTFATAAVAVLLVGVGLFYVDQSWWKESSPRDELISETMPERPPVVTEPAAQEPRAQAAAAVVETPKPEGANVQVADIPTADPVAAAAPEQSRKAEVTRELAYLDGDDRVVPPPPAEQKPTGVQEKAALSKVALAENTARDDAPKAAAAGSKRESYGDGTIVGAEGKLADKVATVAESEPTVMDNSGGNSIGALGSTSGLGRGGMGKDNGVGERAAGAPVAAAEEVQAQAVLGGGDGAAPTGSQAGPGLKNNNQNDQNETLSQPTAPMVAAEASPVDEIAEKEEEAAPDVDQWNAKAPADSGDAEYRQKAKDDGATDVGTHQLAKQYSQSGNVGAAAKMYDNLLQNYPNYAGRKQALAEAVAVYIKQGQKQKAESALSELESSTKDPGQYAKLRSLVDGTGGETTTTKPSKAASKKASNKQAAPALDALERAAD